ncbi:MAG: hypothetical protein IK025_09250 [Bacteroidales bacterium]|nr:hypothetical protein [Bacteroidales bacterium]
MRTIILLIIAVLVFALVSCNERTIQKETDVTDTVSQNQIDTTNCAKCLKYPKYNTRYYPGVYDSLPKEYIEADWMKAYASYILDSISEPYKYVVFSVCFIDNDDIPEICLGNGCCSSEVFLTQHNGIVSFASGGYSFYPKYIEKRGLIRIFWVGCGHTCGYYIVKLENGNFEYLLSIDSGFYSSPIEPYTIQEVYDFRTKKTLVDTLYEGNQYNMGKVVKDAMDREYSSKGISREVFDSAQNVYPIKTLCELFCNKEGEK